MENFPHEIIIDILSRLPIKPLVRCRCVCKFWLNLTHDSRLVNLHLHRASQINSSSSNHCLLLTTATTQVNFGSQFILVGTDESINYISIKLNVPSLFKNLRVMGSCNGLLCLNNSMNRSFDYICNPCNGDYIELPMPIMSWAPSMFVGGFGFDQKTNQYKVVKIVYCEVHGPRSVDAQLQSEVYVYGLGDSSWRHIGEAPYLILGQFSSKAFVNGALHWVSDSPGMLIVSFDIADEVFDVVSWPLGEGSYSQEVLRGRGRFSLVGKDNYSLGVLRGCLSLVNSSFMDHFEIWMMNNYGVQDSWTKNFSINYSEVGWDIGYIQILYFQKNCEVLLLHRHKTLFSCNPRTMTLRKLSMVGLPSLFDAVTYVGTLISPSRLSDDNQRIG